MSRFPSFATVSSKGQITIPLRIRRALDWQRGDHLAVEPRGDVFTLRKISPTLGRVIRERRRARRTLADDEILLLDLLSDPDTTDDALQAQLTRLRRRVREEVARR